jgi:3-oxosteroid 1-dehydrogenase
MGSEQSFDRNFDVVVVGSGAGGMVSAWAAARLGLDVVIIEKSELYGGNSALSGGGAWIPNAPELLRHGQRDDPEKMFRYLRAIAPDVAPERHRRYLAEAPRLVEILEQSPRFRNGFMWPRGYSDYHPEKGGSPLGRGVWVAPIDEADLGLDAEQLRSTHGRMAGMPPGMWLTSMDYHELTQLRWKGWRGKKMLVKLLWRSLEATVRRRTMATSGAALITRLRLMVRDLDVPLWLETPMRSLLTDEQGRVVGVEVEREGETMRLGASRGVVVATGGFERNAEMRAKHQPLVGIGWTSGSPESEGDGIRAGEALGAAVDLMDDAWWMPALQLPVGVWPLVAERAYPEQFIINSAGERFVNEAAPYTDFVHVQFEGHRSGISHIPAYMIVDHHGWTHNLIAGHVPGKPMPKGWLQSGTVQRAATLQELAGKIGVPADALEATASRYNAFAKSGLDEDFHRGESAYDNYYGNPAYPNPNLGEVKKPPFYAFRLVPGDLGTKGGMLTDENARVIREDGSVIPGLYATGNASSSIMGNDYAGPGATIGPAMAFGWVAAHHLADKDAGSVDDAASAAGDSASAPLEPRKA